MTQAIVRILGLIVLGAVLANVLRHPRGTSALFRGVNDFWRTGLQATAGQSIGGGGGGGRRR